jgi:2-dehydropantoate 2-reductase
MHKDKKIAVVGTGANGAAIAADLAIARRDVTLIDQWPENVAAMREHGIRVNLRGQEYSARAPIYHLCEVATLREKFDIVLIVVKAYDTRWATRLIEPILADDGLVIGVQNGLTTADIADIVGPKRTLGCVIENGGAMYDPGRVIRDTLHENAWFALGSFLPETAHRVPEGVDVLKHAGRVEVFDDVNAAKWMKLIVNAAEVAPTAVLNLPLKEAIETPGMREFMIRVGVEAIAVVREAGVDIVPIFGLPDLDAENPRDFIAKLLDEVIYTNAQPFSRVAALQDWMKGRRSEINEINGPIVAKGEQLGRPTPYNRRALDVARRIERHELRPDGSLRELLLDGLNDGAS